VSSYNTPEKGQIPGDEPEQPGVGPKEILPGQMGRCSTCGEEISGSEPTLVLAHPAFPYDALYFHEGEACSERALVVTEFFPLEWRAVLFLPTSWSLLPGPRDEELN
jgi:hypothetical protein